MKNEHLITSIVSVLIAVTGLAIIAVLVSKGAQTGNVLGAFGQSISTMLCKAVSPVTGGSCGSANTSTISYGGVVNTSGGYGAQNPYGNPFGCPAGKVMVGGLCF